MIVSWDFYLKRKRTSAKEWLQKKNILSYNELVGVTQKLGIETPQEEKVSEYFKKTEVKIKNVRKTKKRNTKIKKPISTRPNKSETVQQEIQAKPEEKQPRKRRKYRKRKPSQKEDQ